MNSRIKFFLNRIGERLWLKPLIICVLAIAGAFIAKGAEYADFSGFVPNITIESLETLLTVLSASMLGIATFSVASMVSAYSSAASTATPRSFSLVIADDVSQNALSAFIGSFIFSIISLIAVENSYYDKSGRFTLFVLTLLVFTIVILTFVRWVDKIARLGRLGSTIDKVETATAEALERRRAAPTLGGVAVTTSSQTGGRAVYAEAVGYIQRVDISTLQKLAEQSQTRIEVAALPGVFAAPGRALAFVWADSGQTVEIEMNLLAEAFLIDDDRTYYEDPRFGFIVLSEIASRALSPGINDPGTAIDVIGTLVRLFTSWSRSSDVEQTVRFDRVAVPEIALENMFEDAFRAIARDGAGTVEVVVRLLKALESLASLPDPVMRETAIEQARLTLARAEGALSFPPDLEAVRTAARFAKPV